jgi:DNA-directed RNA polymerase specialized sigma24 family protein
MINELPRLQRQTFVLHALEDDNTAEIAMLQDRPEAEVKADIEAARRTLGERLIAEGAMEESGRPATASSAAGGRQRN